MTLQMSQLHVTPSLLSFLAKDPLVPSFDWSNLKTISVGAAPLDVRLIWEVVERLHVTVRQGLCIKHIYFGEGHMSSVLL